MRFGNMQTDFRLARCDLHKIFVGGIPSSVDEMDSWQLYKGLSSEYPSVFSLKIIRKPDDKPKSSECSVLTAIDRGSCPKRKCSFNLK